MGTRIEFWIPGIPKPGGSKQGFVLRRKGQIVTRPNGAPIVIMKEDSDNATWKNNCAFFACQAHDADPLHGALQVAITFVLPRPKYHFGTGKNAAVLKVDAPAYHTTKPDATKLMRSTEDALTGILWSDDSIIARQFVQKVYGATPGARVVVTTLDQSTPAEQTMRDRPASLFELADTQVRAEIANGL